MQYIYRVFNRRFHELKCDGCTHVSGITQKQIDAEFLNFRFITVKHLVLHLAF